MPESIPVVQAQYNLHYTSQGRRTLPNTYISFQLCNYCKSWKLCKQFLKKRIIYVQTIFLFKFFLLKNLLILLREPSLKKQHFINFIKHFAFRIIKNLFFLFYILYFLFFYFFYTFTLRINIYRYVIFHFSCT